MNNEVIIIYGPTASGKSLRAIEYAKGKNAIIINADASQVYKDIPIISAQPTINDLNSQPHKLYGYLEAHEHNNVARWLADTTRAINIAAQNNVLPIIVGGTGMYLLSLMQGLSEIPPISDKDIKNSATLLAEIGNEKFLELLRKIDVESAKSINVNDSQRLLRAYNVAKYTGKTIGNWHAMPKILPIANYKKTLIEVNIEREILYDRCNKRLLQMLENGAIDEVKILKDRNLEPNLPIMKAIGVPQIISFLNNEITLDEAIIKIQTQTRNYAKRQLTWFRNQKLRC